MDAAKLVAGGEAVGGRGPAAGAAPGRVGALVSAATALLFARTLGAGFVPTWDDGAYVTENARLGAPPGEVVRWAFTNVDVGQYIPITWLSLAADHALSGGAPWSFHLGNTILHAANAALVFGLAVRLLARERAVGRGAVAAAVFAALLFSVHPLRVESVAWVTERKDVLCAFFALAATHAHVAYARSTDGRARAAAYAASLALLLLALLSKPAAVAVPLAWLALDLHPLDRLDGHLLRRVAEKGPHLAAALLVGSVAAFASLDDTFVRYAPPLDVRLLVATSAPVSYLRHALWPDALRALYAYPPYEAAWTTGRCLAAAATVALTAAAIAGRRRAPAAAAAWLAYLALLGPSLGLVQLGPQEIADRFTYLPAVPLSLLAAAALAGAALRRPRLAAPVAAGGGAVLLALAVLSFRQMAHWRDGLALWERVLRFEQRSGIAYSGRSLEHERRGNAAAALADLERAIRLAEGKPWAPLPHLYRSRARILSAMGRGEDAAADAVRAAALERDRASRASPGR